MDIAVACVVLIATLPLLLPIILLLRFTAEGEVFYFQNRVGYRKRNFRIWKFATMLKNSPNMLTGSLTVRNDPRVTTMGKFLRMTKINELPQVINVLLGDMTLVGPRPQMEVDFKDFSASVQAKIYDVKPGITGIGSIVFRDEEALFNHTDLSPRQYYQQCIAPYKGALEMWYQAHMSLATDVKIIFLTAWYIFFPKSSLVYRFFPNLPVPPAFEAVSRTNERRKTANQLEPVAY
ncbi:MAG: hypothetical protein RLY31_2684 [Bacteroidota bacterium]